MTADAAGLSLVHRFEPGEPGQRGEGLVLLLLHGTGGDENDLLPLGRTLAAGAARLSPRGRVLERGAPRWFRRLAEGVFDVDDLIERANELADFVVAASDAYGFDPAGVVAIGFSNGANVAAARHAVAAGRASRRRAAGADGAAAAKLAGRSGGDAWCSSAPVGPTRSHRPIRRRPWLGCCPTPAPRSTCTGTRAATRSSGRRSRPCGPGSSSPAGSRGGHGGHGQRGRPRTRSPRMLRRMLLVPPMIV